MKIQVNVPQLQQALMTNAQLQNQMAGAQQLQQGNGYAGGLGILGAALGGFMQGRKAKELAANEFDINQQIAAFQEQKAQELAMAEQARAEQEYKRKLAEKEQERAFEMQKLAAQQQGQLGLEQFRVNNRQAPQMSAEQQWLNSLSPEQRNQIFAQKYAGQQNSLFTPQEQALIQAGKVNPEQLAQVKANEALGVKDLSAAEKKKTEAQKALRSSMENLYNQVNEHGTEWGGEKGARMKTAYGDFFMKYKNAEELGAIQGADERLVKNILDDPTSFWGQLNPFRGGNIKAQMEEYAKIQGWEDFGAQNVLPQQLNIQGQLTQQGMEKTQQLLNKYLEQ